MHDVYAIDSPCRRTSLRQLAQVFNDVPRVHRRYNFVIGAMRFRQLRVNPEFCSVPPAFSGLYKECFPEYYEEYEDFFPFGNAVMNYTWTSSAMLGAVPIQGKFATYEGNGFVVDVPTSNLTVSQTMLHNMKGSNFIDWQTRAVVMDFTLFNAPLNKLCAVKMLYEFPAQGGITRTVHILFANVFRFETPGDIAGEAQQFIIAVSQHPPPQLASPEPRACSLP